MRYYPADADLSACWVAWCSAAPPSTPAYRQRRWRIRSKPWLVNTGWNGEGKRLSLRDTRSIISAILNGTHRLKLRRGSIIPVFGLAIPQVTPG
ncbi:phosphoenolpyruvate carboxykinase (ATP) [Klebsiella pneumoniae]|nr:phosphoenolpyruvate carboxykinase (ATP) [Klebsiella pneumoniae]